MDAVTAIRKSSTSNRLSEREAEQALAYLTQFGYLEGVTDLVHELRDRIKLAQHYLGVNSDGELGEVTLKAMQTTPRCGCRDVARAGGQLNRWLPRKAKEGLTYHVVGYVRGLSTELQEEILIRAWESWERVCGIKIIRKYDTNADIIIDASASRREEFGTAGNVLAWAYLPQGPSHTSQLLMKFDLAEKWVDDPRMQGILLEAVAAHEFGHLKGLDHTPIFGELMHASYNQNVKTPQPRYDIPEGVKRYGEPLFNTPSPGADLKVEGRITIDGTPYELRKVN